MNKYWSDISNPWKGLEAYSVNDTIYGRDEEIRTLYSRIIYNVQTVVYGKSGIGKSSIINAGITPRAIMDGFIPINIRLAHTDDPKLPSPPYTEQIRKAITKALGVTEETIEENVDTLWDLFHRNSLLTKSKKGKQPEKLILIFDQFEEIFTLERDPKRVRDFFHQLGELINDIIPESKTDDDEGKSSGDLLSRLGVSQRPDYSDVCDYHLVFTLREDYLSHLERHTIFIPAMKDNRFPILPLTARQAYEAIVRPVQGLVSPEVAQHIIKQVINDKEKGEESDIPFEDTEVDAAVLSIYMHQLFELRPDRNQPINDNLVVEKGSTIIRNFYEEAVSDLPEDEIAVLEDKLLTYDDKRDNEAYDNILKDRVNVVSKKTLDSLIKRKLLRTFHHGEVRRVELMHDILCDIISNRIKEREIKTLREVEQLKRKKLMRKVSVGYVMMLTILLATLGMAGFFAYKYINNKKSANKTVDVNFIFLPDRLLDGEPWKCDVELGLIKDTTFHAQWIGKKDSSVKQQLFSPRPDTLRVKVPLNKLNKKFTVEIHSEAESLCRDTIINNIDLSDRLGKKDINVIDYHITLTRKDFFPLEGMITAEDGTPLSGTIIVLDDKLEKTDEKGHFIIALTDTSMLRNKTLNVIKSEYQNVEMKDNRMEAFKSGKQTIRLSLRDSTQFEDEYQQMLSIREHIKGGFTKEDSIYMKRNFACSELYRPMCVERKADGQSFFYFYRYTNNENVALKSQIFGYIKGKNVRLFKGTLPKINDENKWNMDIVAYDRYYNKERIIGTTDGKKLTIDKVSTTY